MSASLFYCSPAKELGPIYQGDDLLAVEYGAVACFSSSEFLLASRYNPEIYWVKDGQVTHSIRPLPLEAEQDVIWECCGLVLSELWDEVFMLIMNSDGLLKILRTAIDMSSRRLYSKRTGALLLPQYHKPYSALTGPIPIDWGNGHIYSSFHLATHFDNSSFLNYHPAANLGLAITAHPPFMTRWANKLILGINHYQFLTVSHQHIVPAGSLSTFEYWANSLENVEYTKNLWWQEQWTGEVLAKTVYQHPVFISSLLVYDPATTRVEGLSHIGSTAFGKIFTYGEKQYLRGLAALDATVECSVATLSSLINQDVMMWGTQSFKSFLAEYGDHGNLFFAFLHWWDQCHLPWVHTTQEMLVQPVSPALYAFRVKPNPQLFHNTTTMLHPDYYSVGLPYSAVESIRDFDISPVDNSAMAVTAKSLTQYRLLHYELESWYGDQLLGRGSDVFGGQVFVGQPKILKVKLINKHIQSTFKNIQIAFLVNSDFPAYMQCQLSWDQILWESLGLSTVTELAPEATLEFYIKFDVTVDLRKPVPVTLDIQYDLS